jgi:PIN domain nuclease of toxin-antitoxin system
VRHIADTHVVVRWLVDDRKLSREHVRVLERCERTGERVAMSAISLWEIAKLVERGRLELRQSLDESLGHIEASALFEVLPLTSRIAIESTRLGRVFPTDPVDQIIAATARCHGLVLLTSDERIIESGAVSVS